MTNVKLEFPSSQSFGETVTDSVNLVDIRGPDFLFVECPFDGRSRELSQDEGLELIVRRSAD